MRTRTTTLLVSAVLLATLTACETTPDEATPAAGPKASATPTLTDEQRAEVREAAGFPDEPDAATAAEFIKALDAIDPRIADGKNDKAVSRGLNQCSSIKDFGKDQEKLSTLALGRFTIDTRLPELNSPETGTKINDAVHKHLCPDF
ncbi:hypothetical protein ACFW6X_34710 [Streptomyces bacillaris]|uniref:hypothetical protein n=1 Tax=Streptomyces bacillaris TaxID=68179 RepID=UPI0036B60802